MNSHLWNFKGHAMFIKQTNNRSTITYNNEISGESTPDLPPFLMPQQEDGTKVIEGQNKANRS